MESIRFPSKLHEVDFNVNPAPRLDRFFNSLSTLSLYTTTSLTRTRLPEHRVGPEKRDYRRHCRRQTTHFYTGSSAAAPCQFSANERTGP